jgi:hypothetical protein
MTCEETHGQEKARQVPENRDPEGDFDQTFRRRPPE